MWKKEGKEQAEDIRTHIWLKREKGQVEKKSAGSSSKKQGKEEKKEVLR